MTLKPVSDRAQYVGICQCGCGGPTLLSRDNIAAKGVQKGQPRRYIRGHQYRPLAPFRERLWRYIDKAGPDQCWLWTGATITGYGTIGLGPRTHGNVLAHRAVYAELVGLIPEGYQVDHLCHNADATCLAGAACQHRRCVNPAHLEAVPQLRNLERQGAAYRLRREYRKAS